MTVGWRRRAVKQRLVELIREDCDGVAVTGYVSIRDLKDRHIFLSATVGTVEYVVFAKNIQPRDDRFTVTCSCFVLHQPISGGTDDNAHAAEAEAERLMTHVQRAIASNPTLGDLEGVIDVTLGQVIGPDARPDDTGAWVAEASIDINVHARMEGW